MKEITRIHIAKVSYDIELAAKKELEAYIQALELYAGDAELLQEIEIRITELLADNGVRAGGVIAVGDITQVKTILGDPSEFADDEANLTDDDGEVVQRSNRRLYRDLDHAVLGGVLSGVAAASRIDVLWVRLLFVVLMIASFGTAAIVYIVLWLAVPPAQTAAEKLQLTGKSVNLASLRMQNDLDTKTGDNKTMKLVRRVLTGLIGAGAAFGAALAFVATIWGAVGLLWGTSDNSPIAHLVPGDSLPMWVAYGLFVTSGLLLTFFFAVVAYAFLTRAWTKKIGIILVSVAVAGCITFGTGIGSAFLSSMEYNQRIEASVRTDEVGLESFAAVRNLHVVGEEGLYVNVVYVASDSTPHYTVSAVPGLVAVTVDVADNPANAKLILRSEANDKATSYAMPAVLTVYGPALDTLSTKHSSVTYENASAQDSLVASAYANTSLTINGTYGTLDARTELQGSVTASISADDATVTHLIASTKGGDIEAGVVRTLTVSQQDVCPAETGDRQNSVNVEAVSGGEMTYNGTSMLAMSKKTACGGIQIGDDE